MDHQELSLDNHHALWLAIMYIMPSEWSYVIIFTCYKAMLSLSHLKIFCILQVFSSLVVTLLLIIRLSCIYHRQGCHALCPHYLTTEFITLIPRLASCVADLTLRTAVSCGHQTRAPGRRLSPWMSRDLTMSPGLQAAATSAHTSWEDTTARGQLHW